MNRKMPLPRGWKRRVRSSVLHILAFRQYTSHLNLLDSMINVSFFLRPNSLDQYTWRKTNDPIVSSHAPIRSAVSSNCCEKEGSGGSSKDGEVQGCLDPY